MDAVNAADAIRVTAWRRRINVELAELQENVLNRFARNDAMSQAIAQWHRQFTQVIRSRRDDNEQVVIDEFIALLQELLQDPIQRIPLDEGALLGSDGRTYNRFVYEIFCQRAPLPYRDRSPLEPNNPEPFTTSPHFVVQAMVKWLQSRRAYTPSLEIEQQHREIAQRQVEPVQLQNRRAIAVAPTHDQRVQQIMERQRQRERQRNARLEGLAHDLELLQRENRGQLQAQFDSIQDRQLQAHQTLLTRVTALEQRDEERLGNVAAAVQQLREEIAELERQNDHLHRQIQQVDEAILNAQRDDVALKIAINETRIAIQKQKESNLNGLGVSIAIIAGCALGTWALQGGLAATGSSASASLMPLAEGVTLNLSFPF